MCSNTCVSLMAVITMHAVPTMPSANTQVRKQTSSSFPKVQHVFPTFSSNLYPLIWLFKFFILYFLGIGDLEKSPFCTTDRTKMLYLFAASSERSRVLFLFMLSRQWFSVTKIILAVTSQKLLPITNINHEP